VPSGRSLPIAVSKQNGELMHSRTHSWRSTAGGVVGGYRALLVQGQMIASGDHNWLAMDQGTGEVGYGWFEGGELIVQGENAFSVTGKELIKMRLSEYAVNSRKRQELKLKLRDASRSAIPLTDKAKQKLQEQLQEIQNQIDQIADVGVDWRTACDSRSALLATSDMVFVGGKGHVTGYSHQTGQMQWKVDIPGEVTGLVAVQGYLLASNDQGQIFVFGSTNDPTTRQPSNSVAQQDRAGSADVNDDIYAQAAERIIQSTGIQRGFCLVLDNQQGRLAQELAKRTNLKIYAVDRSAESVASARQRLLASGLYGHRIAVHHVESALPYSNYFADLIVSDAHVSGGPLPNYESLARHLKPVGGKIALPFISLASDDSSVKSQRLQSAQRWLSELGLTSESNVENVSDVLLLKRGPLPGAGSWSHLYGTPANTAIGNETRVKSELGVLWYGDPGPGEMVNRHDGAVGPLATGGRLFVQGDISISAYDAYNGTFLWKQENPKAIRTGVFQNQNPGNLAATEDRLFHFIQDECFELDAASGQIVRIHNLPPSKQDGQHQWGYMAIAEGHLIGTATVREEVDEKLRRRGRSTIDSTDMLFAIELGSGIHAWEYQGANISHHTVALGPGKVFFIDSSISSQQREEILAQDKSQIALLEGEEKELAERRAKKADIRRAVALDLKSGAELWGNPVDVTDCSDIGIGGGKLTLMYHDGTLILGGANANGHFWEQFVTGTFSRRRLVALSADQGYQKWAKDANYKGRPIVIGDKVLAEPWSFNLQTGDQLTRVHPTTGQKVPWSLMRTGHHCGILTGCESGLLMFRSGDTAFYDLESDSGTNHFSGHRLGCWINAIPANGLVMIPEASAGCVCQFSIASTIVLEPRPQQYRWTIHSAVGSLTPVQSMAINLGAPGDRRDASGKFWLSYPRRAAYKETSLGVDLNLQQVLSESGRFKSITESLVAPSRDVLQWVASSWVEGLQQVTLPLLGPNDQPAQYQIKLILSGTTDQDTASASVAPLNSSRLSILANGQLSEGEILVPVSAENNPATTILELGPYSVKDNLTLDFQVQQGGFRLHGIEVSRLGD
jgi:outer membrane protein assembly factor BamB